MLTDEQLTTAIDDARTRHAALVEVIFFIDQQAMALLGLYLTIGTATASGALLALDPNTFLPPSAGTGLLASTVMLVVGAVYCFKTMGKGTVNLPGRDSDFWLWCIEHPQAVFNEGAKRYLENLQVKVTLNRTLNAKNTAYLAQARRCGIWVPIVSQITGGFDYLLRTPHLSHLLRSIPYPSF